MKKLLALLIGLSAAQVWAQETPISTPASTTTGTPNSAVAVIEKWSVPDVPWDDWFKNNAMVTDKTDYVHFFWNAPGFQGQLRSER